MKKKILLSIITFVLLFAVGCSSNEKEETGGNVFNLTPTPTIEIEPNTRVGYLRFYAPTDYTYRPDLRGLAYDESQKKVYLNGDYENNPNSVIYLITALELQNKDVKEYIDEVNTRLTEDDIRFSLKTNSKNQEVYAREDYLIGDNINYAYILGKSGDIYVIYIKGPKEKSLEISKLAYDVYNSLFIS